MLSRAGLCIFQSVEVGQQTEEVAGKGIYISLLLHRYSGCIVSGVHL